jgi:serine/threonine protein kinase
MLTGGERPFTGERASITGTTGEKVRWEQVNTEPQSPRKFNSRISTEMEAAVMRCLEKEPEKRFSSITELLDALNLDISRMPNITEKPQETVQKARKSYKNIRSENKSRIPLIAGGILITFFAIFLVSRGDFTDAFPFLSTATPVSTATPIPTPTPQISLQGDWKFIIEVEDVIEQGTDECPWVSESINYFTLNLDEEGNITGYYDTEDVKKIPGSTNQIYGKLEDNAFIIYSDGTGYCEGGRNKFEGRIEGNTLVGEKSNVRGRTINEGGCCGYMGPFTATRN